MILPDYWMLRPGPAPEPAAIQAFEQLRLEQVAPGGNRLVDYTLPYPRWQFLCWLADVHGMILHGSPASDIAEFEPRQSNDQNEFGNQKAVYAAGDGLWAMYFAILDRQKHPMTLINACIRLRDPQGAVLGPFYFFSIGKPALEQKPWRTGMVYILPPETFNAQPSASFAGYDVLVPQFASLEPVRPLARLEIRPQDFPFLAQIRGHDDNRLAEYAAAMSSASAWPE